MKSNLKLSYQNIIENKKKWLEFDIRVPEFDINNVNNKTSSHPQWLHFGAGNIFKGFIAVLQNKLLNKKLTDTGIIVAESFDYEIIDKVYQPVDNLSLAVIMEANGHIKKEVIASVTESIKADSSDINSWSRLVNIFKNPSLQMVSFTITEKGYQLFDINGNYFDIVKDDINNGLSNPNHIIAKVVALLYQRFKNDQLPLALVSMDNCSKNGEILANSIKNMTKTWIDKGFVEKEFLNYLNDEAKVTFPWSMIDKITPRPSEKIKYKLDEIGIIGTDIVETKKGTFISAFVNAEAPEYLVIEDKFPNGREKLEEVGVIFGNKETVEKVEKMKVCTCLNPLHTALAIFGCLLNFQTISDEMKDANLKKLVENLGKEGMPVVVDPEIIKPQDFLNEVINERLTNEFIIDIPQRIATDTSQKVAIRFGETIKAYEKSNDLSCADLQYIPLVIAGWFRYLMGIDDNGQEMKLSHDPMMEELQRFILKIKFKDKDSIGDNLATIMANEKLFGINLIEIGIAEKIKIYFQKMIEKESAVRQLLNTILS